MQRGIHRVLAHGHKGVQSHTARILQSMNDELHALLDCKMRQYIAQTYAEPD